MSDIAPVKIADLPTLADRPRPNLQKGPTRVEAKAAKDKGADKAAEEFRAAVWKRDGGKCRCCGRTVVKSLELRPDRGEVHHVSPRSKEKALLTDPRNGILVCALPCHQDLTHHELSIVAKASGMFTLSGKSYINASSRTVSFVRAKS